MAAVLSTRAVAVAVAEFAARGRRELPAELAAQRILTLSAEEYPEEVRQAEPARTEPMPERVLFAAEAAVAAEETPVPVPAVSAVMEASPEGEAGAAAEPQAELVEREAPERLEKSRSSQPSDEYYGDLYTKRTSRTDGAHGVLCDGLHCNSRDRNHANVRVQCPDHNAQRFSFAGSRRRGHGDCGKSSHHARGSTHGQWLVGYPKRRHSTSEGRFHCHQRSELWRVGL